MFTNFRRRALVFAFWHADTRCCALLREHFRGQSSAGRTSRRSNQGLVYREGTHTNSSQPRGPVPQALRGHGDARQISITSDVIRKGKGLKYGTDPSSVEKNETRSFPGATLYPWRRNNLATLLRRRFLVWGEARGSASVEVRPRCVAHCM